MLYFFNHYLQLRVDMLQTVDKSEDDWYNNLRDRHGRYNLFTLHELLQFTLDLEPSQLTSL